MYRRILSNWLSSQITPEIRQRLRETAVESLKEAVSGYSEASSEYEAEKTARPVACGLVFATSHEYGCLTDLMKSTRRTSGAGFRYTDGFLGKKRIVIVETGIGSENAARGTEALLQIFQPERVISAGFSGALVSGLSRPEIVLPKTIIDQKTGERIDLYPKLLAGTVSEKNAAQPDEAPADEAEAGDDDGFIDGTLLTAREVISSPEDKRSAAKEFGATLVDMEGFAVASVCTGKGVPFLSVRVILDGIDETMPRDLKGVADAAAQNPARLLGALFSAVKNRPSSLIDMYKVKENALIAADTLANAIAKIAAMK